MKTGTRFVCELNATPTIEDAGKGLTSFLIEYKQQMLFIRKQVEDLDTKKQKLWRALFDACVAEGKISKMVDYDDISMRLSDERDQLFISKNNSDGMPDFIRKLLE